MGMPLATVERVLAYRLIVIDAITNLEGTEQERDRLAERLVSRERERDEIVVKNEITAIDNLIRDCESELSGLDRMLLERMEEVDLVVGEDEVS